MMPQLDGFDMVLIDNRPRRLRVMHQLYGRDPTHTCGRCKHLIAKQYAHTYYKCEFAKQMSGPGTDWRKSWRACGKFEEKESHG